MSAGPTYTEHGLNIFALSFVEQRGELLYITPDGRAETAQGHFMLELDGRGVIHRKAGGRNHYRFCSIDAVVQFRKRK